VTNETQQVVVMGVSGSGKTTIARRLAEELRFAFADADAFHSDSSVAKMARGEPLTDVDREPWLQSLVAWTEAQHEAGRSTVLACSSLKRRYRDVLSTASPRSLFIHLTAPRAVLLERMKHRQGHYMPAQLLDSQLADLEPLAPDEPGLMVDATATPAAIVEQAADVVTRSAS
jgi:gluconokinase